jgi:arylsulfatase A-like enzyme
VIDSLSARGIRFTEAISQSGWTLPAVSSLLTGTWPVPMQISKGAIPWSTTGAMDIAEILGIYGYKTAIFWEKTLAGGVLDQATRFFNVSSTNTAALPTEEVQRWLATTEEPFLGFVHEIDMNFPSAMPGPYVFDDPAWPDGLSYHQAYQQLTASVGEQRAQAAVLAHYDSVLHNYDAGIGDILKTLENRGIAERTVILLVSNHSQDFFTHTVIDHGMLYDTNLRIPLVIVDPESSFSGIVVDKIVQLIDIAPTILSRAGIPVAASMVGQPLLPPPGTEGSPYQVRPVFSMSYECAASLRTAQYKLIVRDRRSRRAIELPSAPKTAQQLLLDFIATHGLEKPSECSINQPKSGEKLETPTSLKEMLIELYALSEDPDEQRDLIREQPAVALEMLPVLLKMMERQREAGAAAPKNALRPEQVEQIKEQGYWGLVEDATPLP